MNSSFLWGVVAGVAGVWAYHQVRPIKSANA